MTEVFLYNMAAYGDIGGTEVTRLLEQWQLGKPEALQQLTPLIVEELRKLAGHIMSDERGAHTLQPTALVNEAWLKLAGIREKDWQSRAHFFAIAAHVMRQLLMQHARARGAQKRWGGLARVDLDSAMPPAIAPDENLLALDEALTKLAEKDQRTAKVVELRFFGGLEIEEIAEVVGVSVATVGRDLRSGMAWLHRALRATPAKEGREG